MAKYQAVRTFPIGDGETIRRGKVVADPDWPNLDALVRSGYLQKVDEKTKDPFASLSEEDLTDIQHLPEPEKDAEEEAVSEEPENESAMEVGDLIPDELQPEEPAGTAEEVIPEELIEQPKETGRRGRRPKGE